MGYDSSTAAPVTVLILLWNPPPWAHAPGPLSPTSTVSLTYDRGTLPRAAAVVFHIPTLGPTLRLPKPAGQRWVAWSMESDGMYPQLADPEYLAAFDLTMTYRLDSDVPVPYVDAGLLARLTGPPRAAKTEAAPAVFFASNANERSGRTEYVRELMRHLPVDSYGRCLQNRALVDDRGPESKRETIARYRFTLAFENSCTRDYVTEKFFAPLVVGSVPVVLGAPNVADFAPGENCYLDVRDVAGPRELAARLQELAADERSYAELLAWKERPLRAAFTARFAPLVRSPFERLGERLGVAAGAADAADAGS